MNRLVLVKEELLHYRTPKKGCVYLTAPHPQDNNHRQLITDRGWVEIYGCESLYAKEYIEVLV